MQNESLQKMDKNFSTTQVKILFLNQKTNKSKY